MLLSPCSITMLLSLNILSLSLIYSITLSLSHFLHHSLTDQHSFPLFISHQTYLYTTHVSPKTHSLLLTPFSQSNSLAISIHFHTQTLSSLWVKLSSYLYPFSHSNSIHSLSQTLSILSLKLYPFSQSNSIHSLSQTLSILSFKLYPFIHWSSFSIFLLHTHIQQTLSLFSHLPHSEWISSCFSPFTFSSLESTISANFLWNTF